MTLNDNWYGRFLTPALLLGMGAFVVPACSSDDKKSGNGTDAGETGGTSGAGGSGTGGHSTGGTVGSGGAGTGGGRPSTEGGVDSDASTDGGATDAGPPPPPPNDAGPSPEATLCSGDAGPDAGGAGRVLLVAGTDFTTSTQAAAIDLARGCVLGRSSFADGDAVVAASGNRGFVIERTNAALDLLSPTGTVTGRVELHGDDAGPKFLDPHAIVLPGAGASKGYVSLFGGDGIAVVDLSGKAVTHVIDLGSLVSADDADGSADPDGGFYDAVTGYVYFVLGRIDRTTIAAPHYELTCPTLPGLLVAINPASDALVDLNGGDPGVGVPLNLVGPTSVALDTPNRRVLIAQNGCFAGPDGGAVRVHHGVEAVNLDTFATSVLYAPTSQDLVNGLVLFSSATGALDTFDALFTEHWNLWSTSSPSLGGELANVPQGAVADGADTLVGVTVLDNVRAEVTRYSVSTQSTTVVTERPWSGLYTSVANAALVK